MMTSPVPSQQGALPPLPVLESYWVIPGRFLAGEYPARPYDQSLTVRRLDSFLEKGINTFINLTREGEVEDYASLLRERAGYSDLTVECLQFPIGDFGLPRPPVMIEILDALDHALERQRNIYLHCYAGIGRTGLAVGCFMVRHGRTGQQALQELAGLWQKVPKSARNPQSPETLQQRDFVLKWIEL